MAVDWNSIGLPRWYDCKLGRVSDSELARLVGTTMTMIRYRRMLFEIPVYTVAQVLEPYLDRLGVDSDRAIAAQCGVSPPSVKAYRMSLGIAPAPLPGKHIPTRPLMTKGHALRPYRSLLGFVADQELADFVGLPVEDVEQIRQAMGLPAAAAAPDIFLPEQHPNYPGPWLVYESLFGSMSVAKISRATGIPYKVIEDRRIFLGVPAYGRPSRIDRYKHLVGRVPNNALARFVGLSPARVFQIYNQMLDVKIGA